MAKDNLQWHPAFYDNTPIRKNIGRIFRKYNIIEYKSPTDYLSVDDFYLVYAYACLYKSDTNHINEISVEDVTITFVSSHYPRELINHLKDVRKYQIEYMEKGICYVRGDFFPIQIVLTKDLSDEENLWLHNLDNDIQEKKVIERLLFEYQKHNGEKLYSSVMNIITNANAEKFKEVTGMCEALERIYLEVNGERLARERKEELDKAVAEAIEKTRAEQAAYIKELEEKLAMQSA